MNDGAITPEERRQLLRQRLLAEAGIDPGEQRDTSINRRSDDDEPILTDAQKRLWFLHQLEPDPSVLNVRVAVRLHGMLDPELFPTCLARLVADHDVFQWAIVDDGGTPSLERLDDPTIGFRYDEHDLASEAERVALAERVVREDRARVFDLASEVPVAVRLVRLGSDDHLLSVGMHHAVSDDWTRWVFLRDLIGHYCHLVDPESPRPQPSPVRYRDYAAWLQDRLDDDLDAQLEHWRQELGDHPTPTELPPDRPRPARHTVDGNSISRTIPAELVGRIRQLSTANQATVFMTLLSGFSVVLARSTHSSDVVVGTPVAGRSAPETHDMLGVFLNTLVLRLETGGNPTFAELIARARTTSLDGFANQEVPFERLLEELNPPRDPSRTPFFSTFFNMTSREYPDTLGPFRLSAVDLQEEGAKFDLTLYAHDSGSELLLTAVYNTRLYDQATVERVVDQFVSVLEQVVEKPDTPIMSLDLSRAEDAIETPDPEADLPDGWVGTVVDAVAKNQASDPDRVAVTGPDATWTRADLFNGTLGLAGALREAGLGDGDPVAIVGARSEQLPAAVLACLTANTPYLILDPAYPAGRLARYLDVVAPRALLRVAGAGDIDEATAELLDGLDVAVDAELPVAPADFRAHWPVVDRFEPPMVAPGDPACFHFTSGSTGVPKAVVGGHGSLTFFQDWMATEFGFGPDDRFSLLSGLAHDPLQRDLLTAMWVGAPIVVPNPDRLADPGWLARWLRDQRISVAHLTPAMGQLATDTAGGVQVPDLANVFFTGAALRWELVSAVNQLAPAAQMVNLYGATETQRASGWQRVDPTGEPPADGTIPIGHPMPGVQLIVRNEGGQVCGPGEIGQLFVRSAHLSLGYHREQGEIDTTGFRPAPGRSGGREREYASGDLARVRPDGAIEHRGRIDHQVKVRGFRVEPADVAQGLSTHPDVTRTEVVVWGGDEPAIGAYVVVAPGSSTDNADILRHARQSLPAPLVPTRLKIVDQVPLTPNGKVDPEPLTAVVTTDDRTEPVDELERMLLDHWRSVLRRDDVGVNDNFFDLGGYSLLATRLFALIEQSTGRRLPVATLFEAPTVARLADVLRGDRSTAWTSLVPIQPSGPGQPFYYVTPYSISVLQLAQLGETLGREQPLYGLQPQGLDGEAPIHTTIEEMAAHYIAEVRSNQPEGPYAIGGHCSGSWVAFEMARQLEADGQEVNNLILVDQGPPGVDRPKTAVWRYVVHRLRFFNADGRLLDALRWQLRIAVGRLLLRRVGSSQRRLAEEVNASHHRAHGSYVGGGHLDADILFLRSEEAIRLGDRQWHLEWQRFTEGGFVTDTVPSTHAMLLEQPYVTTLADRIRRWLDRSEAADYEVEG